jgi:hypothetical protein
MLPSLAGLSICSRNSVASSLFLPVCKVSQPRLETYTKSQLAGDAMESVVGLSDAFRFLEGVNLRIDGGTCPP